MATARISESLWTCSKRWELEAWLVKAGHKWPAHRSRQPMCAAECICRILAWMDARCRPDGSLADVDVDAVELAGGWAGDQGLLCEALVRTGWIDQTPLGMFWHDYGSFNGMTLRDRLKKQGNRPGTGRGFRSDLVGVKEGDTVGDKVGDEVGDKQGASGSGSGSGSVVRVRDPQNTVSAEDVGRLVEAWNAEAQSRGLPKAQNPKTGTARFRQASGFIREAGSIDTALAALAPAAASYAGMVSRGQKAYGLWNLTRPSNRGAYIDAAADGRVSSPDLADPEHAAAAAEYLRRNGVA